MNIFRKTCRAFQNAFPHLNQHQALPVLQQNYLYLCTDLQQWKIELK